MATYKYSAVDKNGKTVSGTIEADNEQRAADQLKKEGKMPIEVKEQCILDKDINMADLFKKKIPFIRVSLLIRTQRFDIIPCRRQVGVLLEILGFRKNVPAFTPNQDIRTPVYQSVGNTCNPFGHSYYMHKKNEVEVLTRKKLYQFFHFASFSENVENVYEKRLIEFQ